ncbi:hypothetical protein OLMES_0228 [Oleiphilus messinensis]|uniref:Uncharacterized protein n=1 Tax=Oleiphilus messinensis TaxID=141451 RepID=A0A1Y0I4F1_9GAMM|nr:hypothetical protein OLMES_0228 [Oleiphilus messinensis]
MCIPRVLSLVKGIVFVLRSFRDTTAKRMTANDNYLRLLLDIVDSLKGDKTLVISGHLWGQD